MFLQERIDLNREIIYVKIQRVVKKFERLKMFAGLVANQIVSAPTPIGSQNGVAAFSVVSNSMMNCACAARRRDRSEVTCGLVIGESQIDNRVEIIGQSGNRRVGDKLRHIHFAENFFYGVERRKFALLVQNYADCRVSNFIFAVNFYRLVASLVGVEDGVF